MPAIDPELIPGANLDPDAVDDAARGLRADALAVRDAGVDVVGAWYGLRADYQAPEADQLLSALDPVRSDTAMLGDDLEQVATALGRFAQELRAIKSAFDVVRADAWAFHARIATNPEWEFDPELVAQNTTLLGRVNRVQVQLWDAERECANAIRAIDCLAPWNAGVSDGPADPNAFGLTTIPSETEMPWGAPVEQKEHCPASAVTSVRSAVWDGFAKDVVGEGFLGLGGLVGLDEHGFSAETFTATWGGMGALIGRDPASGQWSWGTAGDAWLETGKSLVAWDMWEEDPARAFGTAAGNILLTVATLGTGAAIKGVATAGRTGQVLSATMQGARILGNAMDPIAVLRGGTSLVSTTRAAGVTAGLSAGLRSLSQIDLPEVPVHAGLGAATEAEVFPEAGSVASSKYDGPGLSNRSEPAGMQGNDIPARMEATTPENYTSDNGHADSAAERMREPAMASAVTRNTEEAGQSGSHVVLDRPAGGGDAASGTAGSGGPDDNWSGHGDSGNGGHGGEGRSSTGEHAAPDAGGGNPHGNPPDGSDGGEPDRGGSGSDADAHTDAPATDAGGPGAAAATSYPAPDVAQHLEAEPPSPRKPFAALTDLEPNTAYEVPDRGTFYTDETGRVTHVEAQYGRKGALNWDLMNPQPNVTYVVDGNHVFITDDLGRTIEAHVEHLDLLDADRSESVQRRVGNVGGANYDGGHLVGNAFGGGPEVVNLVPQLADSNRGVGPGDTFHALETRLRGLLKQDPPANISLHLYPEYGSGGRVPSIITVDFEIDGVVQRKEFDNV